MPLQQLALPLPLRQSLSRRCFLNRLGLGTLALTGPFVAHAHTIQPPEVGGTDTPETPSSRDSTPRMVNGWLLSESDL